MKIFALAALLFFSFAGKAQLHLAVKTGGQINSASYTTNMGKISTSAIAGFNAGVLTRVYFDDGVAFVSGLEYNAKGYTIAEAAGEPRKTYHLNYIDLPLMVQVDFTKATGKGLYAKAGPCISTALFGREMYTDKNGGRVNNPVIMSVTGDHFGLFGASLNAAIGYSLNKTLFAEAGYAYGIGNINNNRDGANIKTRIFSLSLGYFLR